MKVDGHKRFRKKEKHTINIDTAIDRHCQSFDDKCTNIQIEENANSHTHKRSLTSAHP